MNLLLNYKFYKTHHHSFYSTDPEFIMKMKAHFASADTLTWYTHIQSNYSEKFNQLKKNKKIQINFLFNTITTTEIQINKNK